METKISKALMNRLVDAVTTEWGIGRIQDDWIIENIEKLNGTGIQYSIEKQKTRVKALFNIGNNTQVEMFVTHKKFPEQIASVVNTLTAIKQLVDDTGITINMKRVSSNVSWKEV